VHKGTNISSSSTLLQQDCRLVTLDRTLESLPIGISLPDGLLLWVCVARITWANRIKQGLCPSLFFLAQALRGAW
jgi:hypothetical protein